MKKTLLLLTLAFTSYNYAQNVNIPDANFKNVLLAHGVTITGSNISKIDTNDDGEIQVTEAEVYTGEISVANKNISSLIGIEAFTAITNLYCNLNQLTTLDISNNSALVLLDCNYNQLTSLDITQNTSLYYLYCNHNQLTTLDVDVNTDLRYLYCNLNQLTSLDVSSNVNLTILGCGFNQLTSLNIANGKNYILNDFFAENNPNLTCIQIDNTPKSSWQKDVTASYSTNCALSTNNFELSKQVTIYPNPAKDHFQIDLENSLELKTITVYNNLGQQVVTTNSSKVNTSTLSKGMYYVEIVTNTGKANKKIIVE